MAYVVPIHGASSIRHALKLRFLTPDEDCLVIAKANRLEFYTQNPDDGLLSLIHSKAIYGKVSFLEKLPRPSGSATDHLVVGTDRYTYFTLAWDAAKNVIYTDQKYHDIADKSARDSQTGDRVQIEPSGRFMTLELYEGLVVIVPVMQMATRQRKNRPIAQYTPDENAVGYLGELCLARIEELSVRSSAFLCRDPAKAPRMAMLYQDNKGKVRIKIRELAYSGGEAELKELTDIPEPEELELGATFLIPVPSPLDGLLILGETTISYYDDTANELISRPLKEATVFVAWEKVDGQRWLLADDYGRLYFLMLVLDEDNNVKSWKLDLLGETSRASVLVYLGGGVVFVGSHQGDSQLIRIVEGKFEIIQTFANIAPILDFTIMDLGNRSGETQTHEFSSGQARIITGSGAFNDGTLRSVRSGVGMEEMGVLPDIGHITDLWALRTSSPDGFSDSLVVSFVGETRIFKFSQDADVEEVEQFYGLNLSESTLLATNLPNDRILQVTERDTRIAELDGGMVTSTWSPPTGQIITAASANDDYLVLVTGGQTVHVIGLKGDLASLVVRDFGSNSQVSGIDIPSSPTETFIAGFPQRGEVAILSLTDLQARATKSLGLPGEAVPRSVLVADILPNSPPTLFVSMADGCVVTFSFGDNESSLSGMNKLVLGSEQPSFKKLPRGNGLYNVFATCENPSLIYGSEGRIIYSAVNSDQASRTCFFNSEAYPGAVALATANDLKIVLVDTERTTQLQTLPVGETVRRIAYSPAEKAFGIGTIKRSLENGAEIVQSHFMLADEIAFRKLDVFELNTDELVESVLRATVSPAYEGARKDIFIVGTSYLDIDDKESIRGRILIFDVDKDRKLSKITELPVKGACRALAMMDGKVVAALTKTVVVYNVIEKAFGNIELAKTASYRTSTAPIDITVAGNLIAVSDLMKSVSLVEFNEGENGLPDSLTEVARHYQTVWGTAVAHVDEDTFLESDAEGNLIVLRRNVNGVTDYDKRRLEVTGELLLGEMVNRIRPITTPQGPDAVIIPRAFMATVEGSIYLFALIDPSYQDFLMRLQAAIASHVVSPGNMPFQKYRAFKSGAREADEPFRFVDGELIERFLDCDDKVQGEVVKAMEGSFGGQGVELERVKGIVEGLRRLH